MKVKCRRCGAVVDVPITPEQYKRWQDGELIQRAAPNLSADQREMLISGICGDCFDAMFRHDEDEGDET